MSEQLDLVNEANKYYLRVGVEAIPSNVRGHYLRTPSGWELIPEHTVRKPYKGQHALPEAFRFKGQELIPLDAAGLWDERFPPSIRLAQLGRDTLGRGHIVHLLHGRDKPRQGTLYVFAPSKDRRTVELVTDHGDVKDLKRSVRRVADILAYGDEALREKYTRELDLEPFRYTPMNDELPHFAANLS